MASDGVCNEGSEERRGGSGAIDGGVGGSRQKNLRQVLGFLGVGLFNTVLNYGVYCAVIALGGHYLVASIAGWVISVFSAWVLQYLFVFREGGADSPQPWWQALVKTYLSYGFTGFILANVLLVLMLDIAHVEVLFEPLFVMDSFFVFGSARAMAEYVAPLIVMVINLPINFLLNKFWAYREKGTGPSV